jgi:DNA-binding transcriptional ArsR family regulator
MQYPIGLLKYWTCDHSVTYDGVVVAADDVFETVFKALADAGRRALLDALFASDGQRLNELCAVLPGITRFGVMKHLAVLESAGLVTTEKVGREKRHYLNPVPIQQIYDRWLSKYSEPFTRALVGLKQTLETHHDPSQETA